MGSKQTRKKNTLKALGALSPFLDNFDENNGVTILSGIHEEKDLANNYRPKPNVCKGFLNLMIIAAFLHFLTKKCST